MILISWPFPASIALLKNEEKIKGIDLSGSYLKEASRYLSEIDVDIIELISLIKNASYVISNDTGPAHICSHLNKKGLALFGSHTSPQKVSIGENNMKALEVKNLKDLKVDTVISKIKTDLNEI